MEFSPFNHIVQLCLQGMEKNAQGDKTEAISLFELSWEKAENDFEKFLSANYLSKHQKTITDELKWLEITLEYGLKINDNTVKSAFPSLYTNIGKCYESLNLIENAKSSYEKASNFKYNISDLGPFYHGTKAKLNIGDLLTPGGYSNYQTELKMNHIYFTANLNGAGLAAALAKGEDKERVYQILPLGNFENDPNVTDKKFPGNPTRSYRSESPLKIIKEITEWV